MTEKRFTCETKTRGSVSIDLMKDNGQIIEKFEAINLLNELNDENEQLKDALNQRTEQCDKYYKENEQLKSENEKQVNALKNLCDVEICEICEHQECWMDITPYGNEYDCRCKKGFKEYKQKFYGVEVQKCDDFELRRRLYE